MFKSRSTIPPGGWAFRQPQTGWPTDEEFEKMRLGFTFDQWTAAIIAHREANPRFNLSTDPSTVAMELEFSTYMRIKGLKGAAHYLVDPKAKVEPPKTIAHSPSVREVVGTAAASVGKVYAGARTIIDWLGSGGKPVAQTLADARSATCATCPNNKPAHWMEWATGKLAASIKAELEAKNQMRLATPHDGAIHTCSACLCWLPLKVWAPLDVILKYQSEETKTKLHPSCWILSESTAT